MLTTLGVALSPFRAVAQEQGRRVCVFPSVDLSVDGDRVDYRHTIAEVIESELVGAGFTIVPRREWSVLLAEREVSPGELLKGPTALKVARSTPVDFALNGFYRVDGKGLLLEIKCYDVSADRMNVGVLKSGSVRLALYDTVRDALAEILPIMEKPTEPLTVDGSGQLTVRLRTATLYTLRAEHADYYPVEESVFLGPSFAGELEIDRGAASRFAFELALNNLAYLNLAYSVCLVLNYFYLGLGLTTYYAGLPVWNSAGGKSVEQAGTENGFPLNHINLSTGPVLQPTRSLPAALRGRRGLPAHRQFRQPVEAPDRPGPDLLVRRIPCSGD